MVGRVTAGGTIGPAIRVNEHPVLLADLQVFWPHAPVVDQLGELGRWHEGSIREERSGIAPKESENVLLRSNDSA